METKGQKVNGPASKSNKHYLTVVGQDQVLMNDDHRNTCLNILSVVEGWLPLMYQELISGSMIDKNQRQVVR